MHYYWKHAQWVHEELDILEKTGSISWCAFPWSSPFVIVPKKVQPGEQPQKCLCVDYHVLNSLLAPVVKDYTKVQGALYLVPLQKNYEL